MSCSTLRMLNELIPECGRMKTFTLSNACNIIYIKIYMITKAYFTLHVIPKLVKLLPFKPTRKRTLISFNFPIVITSHIHGPRPNGIAIGLWAAATHPTASYPAICYKRYRKISNERFNAIVLPGVGGVRHATPRQSPPQIFIAIQVIFTSFTGSLLDTKNFNCCCKSSPMLNHL